MRYKGFMELALAGQEEVKLLILIQSFHSFQLPTFMSNVLYSLVS